MNSLGVRIVRIHLILLKLGMREKETEIKKEEERRTKLKFSCSIFSTVRKSNGTLGYILHKNS